MLKTVQSNNKYIRMGGNFLLFILMFIVMLDPTNSVLHLKNLAFVALLGYSIFDVVRLIHKHIESLQITFGLCMAIVIYKQTDSRF